MINLQETLQKGYQLVLNSLIGDKKISNGAFRLLLLLQKYCFNNKYECFPSQKTLSEELGCTIRTIQNYIRQLVKAGQLLVKRRGSISNLYTIISKKILTESLNATSKVKEIEATAKKENAKNFAKATNKKKVDNFNNYEQRQYTDEQMSEMEKKLLGWTTEIGWSKEVDRNGEPYLQSCLL